MIYYYDEFINFEAKFDLLPPPETRALQQKKIFTNWVNAQLDLAEQASFEEAFLKYYVDFNSEDIETRLAAILKQENTLHRVKDLYNDLSDGKVLLKLLEIFTGRKVNLKNQ